MKIKDFINPQFLYFHLSSILINILYIFTCIQYSFYNVYNYINNKFLKLYDEHFDKEIFKICYINENGVRYNIYNILNDPVYFIKCLIYKTKDIQYKSIKYKNSLIQIISLLDKELNGIIIVDIYKNQKHNKLIINLEYLYQNIEVFNLINIFKVINSFLIHKINKNIIDIQIEDDENKINITKDFFLYSKSYCNNNITVQNLINVINVLNNKNYNKNKYIKLTDTDLNETIYRSNNYLNL